MKYRLMQGERQGGTVLALPDVLPLFSGSLPVALKPTQLAIKIFRVLCKDGARQANDDLVTLSLKDVINYANRGGALMSAELIARIFGMIQQNG